MGGCTPSTTATTSGWRGNQAGRWSGHRSWLVDGRPVAAFSQISQSAVEPRPDSRQEDLRHHGLCAEGGHSVDRHQRFGRGAHSERAMIPFRLWPGFSFAMSNSRLLRRSRSSPSLVAGGAAYSPALTDFLIMTRTNASISSADPKSSSGHRSDRLNGGDWRAAANASVSGNVHSCGGRRPRIADRTQAAFVPALEQRGRSPAPAPLRRWTCRPTPCSTTLYRMIRRRPLRCTMSSTAGGRRRFSRVHRDFARNLVVGFGRVQGIVAGFVSQQSSAEGRCAPISTFRQGARFIRFCIVFNIRLFTLVDVPGFLPGIAQEGGGIIRHGAKMLFAYAASTVPKLTFILRKAYGGAYLAMCSRDMGADSSTRGRRPRLPSWGRRCGEGAFQRKSTQPAIRKPRTPGAPRHYREKFCLAPYEAPARG